MKFRRKIPHTSQLRQTELETLLAHAEELLVQGQPDLALDVLEKAPVRLQNNDEYRYLRGVCYLAVGESLQAIEDLERGLAREPEGSPRWFELVAAYAEEGLLAHCWTAAARHLQARADTAERLQHADNLLRSVRPIIEAEALRLGIGIDVFRKAALAHERALLHLGHERYEEVLAECATAIRVAPRWTTPRNNRSQAHLFMGEVAEARREAEYVLRELDANDLYALSTLILCAFVSFEDDVLAQWAARVHQIVQSTPLAKLDVPQAIDALTWAEDAESLWVLGRQLLKTDPQTLPGFGWYALGAAAANLGKLKEARRFFTNALDTGVMQIEWVEEGLRQINRRQRPLPGVDIQGRFPYHHYSRLMPARGMEELFSLSPDTPGPKMAKFLRTRPYLLGAMRMVLWHEETPALRQMALELLLAVELPQVTAHVRAFASSQCGTSKHRIEALHALHEAGHLPEGELVDFWDEKHGEWREVNSQAQRFREPEAPPCNAAAAALVTKANEILLGRVEEPDATTMRQAIAYLEKAIAADPNCAMAVHNMGIQYMNLGEYEKGEELVRKSVEIDPDYLFGYVTLADIAHREGQIAEAKTLANRVATAPLVFPQAFMRALHRLFWIALDERDTDQAAGYLKTMEGMLPESPELPGMRRALDIAELASRFQTAMQGRVQRAQLRQLQKPITREDDLSTCLARISREALVGALRAWRITTSGRKADLITRLSRVMLDPAYLHDFVDVKLRAAEREALNWVLAGGGMRPWEEFTRQFGDDVDESPDWQYHEPETTPGRLKMLGLMTAGTLDGQVIAFIAPDLRPVLVEVLGRAGGQ